MFSVFWCFLVSCFSSKCFRRCFSGVPKVPGWGPKEFQGAILVDHTEWFGALFASIFHSSSNLVTFFEIRIKYWQLLTFHGKICQKRRLATLKKHGKPLKNHDVWRIYKNSLFRRCDPFWEDLFIENPSNCLILVEQRLQENARRRLNGRLGRSQGITSTLFWHPWAALRAHRLPFLLDLAVLEGTCGRF